jgi:N-methylhydantoinase A
MIEITTIGAGGGSIAAVDAGGLLQVGPESAGSDPGPVAYGLGSTRPTVTDANLVLGRINADRPIGGKLARLDVAAARRAIEAEIGARLGLPVEEAAEAIVRVADSKMAGAIRLVSIERGHDPRQFMLMPFGGGGALHAGALVDEVGLAGALVPRYPGVTSALGCVIADMRHDFVQTVNRTLDDLDPSALGAAIAGFAEEGEGLLARSGVRFTATETALELDMLYVGQTHTVAVPLERADAASRETIRAAFERRYREIYGRLLDGIPMRILNLRVAVIGRRPKLDLAPLAPREGHAAPIGAREIYAEGGWREALVYARLGLPVGTRLGGPALLEQPDTTIYLPPGFVGEVDRFGNFTMRRS